MLQSRRLKHWEVLLHRLLNEKVRPGEEVVGAAARKPAPPPDRPGCRTTLALRVAQSAENGRAGATNERRPSRAARPISAALEGKRRALGPLWLGRAWAALAPRRLGGRRAWASDLGRQEGKRDPSAKTLPGTRAQIPLSPRSAVLASQRSEVPGAPHPSRSRVPRGHCARPCTPAPYLVGYGYGEGNLSRGP